MCALCNYAMYNVHLIHRYKKKRKWQNETNRTNANTYLRRKIEKLIGILTLFGKCDMLTYHLLGRWITFWPMRWLKQFILRFYVQSIVIHFKVCMCSLWRQWASITVDSVEWMLLGPTVKRWNDVWNVTSTKWYPICART